MNTRTLIFCDFDGTVAERDVGYHLFKHFSGGRNDELIPDWKAGRISSREILLREAEMVDAPAQDILDFLDQFDLDPGFADFVDLCKKKRQPTHHRIRGHGFLHPAAAESTGTGLSEGSLQYRAS